MATGNFRGNFMSNAAEEVFYLSKEDELDYKNDEDKFTNEHTPREISPLNSTQDWGGKELDREQFLANSWVSETSQARLNPLGVESNLTSLAELIANITESYTTAIFLADNEKERLYLAGAHTLSRDFIEDAQIAFGSGLVGWVAENKVRVSVCPFEHDSTTLLIYRSDQGLKSFMAVPIVDETENLLGVIACDSMKSYAFSKTAEKVVIDCAKQASTLIELNKRIENIPNTNKVDYCLLDETIQKLRSTGNEKSLLEKSSQISNEIISYDAFVVVTASENGVGAGRYYGNSPGTMEHRLLELVCKHKKIICSERSVHALPADDLKQRSFLSIPFKCMEREAGSLNLLSKPHQAFDAAEIAAIEKIADVVGCELERIRLKEIALAQAEPAGFLQWNNFEVIAKSELAKARENNLSSSLLRIYFNNLAELESIAGVSAVLEVEKKILRIIEQVKRDSAQACRLFDSQILLLIDSREVENFIHRLCNQIERLSFKDLSNDVLADKAQVLGDVLLRGINIVVTKTPKDGETLAELSSKSLVLSSKTA